MAKEAKCISPSTAFCGWTGAVLHRHEACGRQMGASEALQHAQAGEEPSQPDVRANLNREYAGEQAARMLLSTTRS